MGNAIKRCGVAPGPLNGSFPPPTVAARLAAHAHALASLTACDDAQGFLADCRRDRVEAAGI